MVERGRCCPGQASPHPRSRGPPTREAKVGLEPASRPTRGLAHPRQADGHALSVGAGTGATNRSSQGLASSAPPPASVFSQTPLRVVRGKRWLALRSGSEAGRGGPGARAGGARPSEVVAWTRPTCPRRRKWSRSRRFRSAGSAGAGEAGGGRAAGRRAHGGGRRPRRAGRARARR